MCARGRLERLERRLFTSDQCTPQSGVHQARTCFPRPIRIAAHCGRVSGHSTPADAAAIGRVMGRRCRASCGRLEWPIRDLRPASNTRTMLRYAYLLRNQVRNTPFCECVCVCVCVYRLVAAGRWPYRVTGVLMFRFERPLDTRYSLFHPRRARCRAPRAI